MPDEPAPIDRDKLRAAIRMLGPGYVFYMLDVAIVMQRQQAARASRG